MSDRQPNAKPYMNPYLAGVGLGIVLLLTFVIMGRGLGASGAMSSTLAFGVNAVAPDYAQNSAYYKQYVGEGMPHPLKDWLVFEVMGLLVGGAISALIANRIHVTVERGPRINRTGRIVLAIIGGILMGYGAKLASGCTSGQALSGGALLNLGSWAFMMMVFAGGYITAFFVRRQWL